MNGVSQQGDVAGRPGIDLRHGAQSQDEGLFWLALLYEGAQRSRPRELRACGSLAPLQEEQTRP